MLFRIHPDSGVPIYLQLVRQVMHAIETGALRPGEQLPAIHILAEEVVTNPNTVAKAYRELEYTGAIELRQGPGAFVRANSPAAGQAEAMKQAHRLLRSAVAAMQKLGLSEASMRRVFEAELTQEQEAAEVASSRRCQMRLEQPVNAVRGLRKRLGSVEAVFGDYIDIYDIQRAVEDGATVRIFYEGRLGVCRR